MTSRSNTSVKIFVSLVSSVQGRILGVCAPSGFFATERIRNKKFRMKPGILWAVFHPKLFQEWGNRRLCSQGRRGGKTGNGLEWGSVPAWTPWSWRAFPTQIIPRFCNKTYFSTTGCSPCLPLASMLFSHGELRLITIKTTTPKLVSIILSPVWFVLNGKKKLCTAGDTKWADGFCH